MAEIVLIWRAAVQRILGMGEEKFSQDDCRAHRVQKEENRSKKAGLALGKIPVEILIGAGSGHATAGSAVEHADLHEIGLVHFLDSVFILAEGSGERAETNGAAIVFVEKRKKEIAVDLVEAVFIYAEHAQRILSDFAGDASGSADFGEIACAAEQAIGYTWRAAATAGDFLGAGFIHLNIQDFRGAAKNDEQVFGRIEIEAMNDAKAGAQGRSNESGAGGGADKREMIEMKGMDARAGTLADDKVNAEIFHGGIEDFFDGGLQPVNFIKKENFLFFKGGEDGREVTFAFKERAGTGLDGHIEFVGDDLGESGFTEAGGAVKENMIKGLAAGACGLNGDSDVFLDALLADVFVEAFGANAGIEASVVVKRGAGDDARIFGWDVGHEGKISDISDQISGHCA